MTDHHDPESIRRGLAVLVGDAPLAPEFDDLTTIRARPVQARKPNPLAVAGISAAAVLATFLAGAIWIGQSGGSSDPTADSPVAPSDPAFTTSTLASLEPGEYPNVFVDAPGWSVVYVEHSEGSNTDGEYVVSTLIFSNEDIEAIFSNEGTKAELRMDSGVHADIDALIADRVSDATRLADQPIWDTNAVVVLREPSNGPVVDTVPADIGPYEGGAIQGPPSGIVPAALFVAMWERNAVEYEFRAHGIDEETFRSLLSSLTQTNEGQWISNLSEDIVVDRAQVVPTYLQDVSLPPGFDLSSLMEGPAEHWYHVAANTISAVTCSWIDYWVNAKTAGDTNAAQAAVDAMTSSHDWQILEDMVTEGGHYSYVVWEYADAMADDGTIVAGGFTTVEATYNQAFGCSS